MGCRGILKRDNTGYLIANNTLVHRNHCMHYSWLSIKLHRSLFSLKSEMSMLWRTCCKITVEKNFFLIQTLFRLKNSFNIYSLFRFLSKKKTPVDKIQTLKARVCWKEDDHRKSFKIKKGRHRPSDRSDFMMFASLFCGRVWMCAK